MYKALLFLITVCQIIERHPLLNNLLGKLLELLLRVLFPKLFGLEKERAMRRAERKRRKEVAKCSRGRLLG